MKKNFWTNKRVLVTGGAGFLGSHIVKILKTYQPQEIIIPRSSKDDLRDQSVCARVVKDVVS